MIRFRPESHGFLLFLSFCLVGLILLAGPVRAATPPMELHDDHGGEGGTTTGAAPEAQGPTPCVNGFAGIYPCRNVDLLSLLPLSEMGAGAPTPGTPVTRGSDIWGWTDPQTGREYALMVLSNGASFVDVTDPTRPRYLGHLPSQSGQVSGNRDVRVYKDHAYVVGDAVGRHGMQVFDLARLRGLTKPQTFQADHVFTGADTVHNLDIDVETGYAYLVGSNVCAGGLYVVDLRGRAGEGASSCRFPRPNEQDAAKTNREPRQHGG